MAPVVVLVPWRPTPARQPLWDWVRRHLEGLGLPIYTADSTGDLFSLAQAFNVAADRPWSKAVLSEADVWTPLLQVRRALQSDADLVWCFDRQLKFTAAETDAFLREGVMPARPLREAHHNMGSNGVRVITRELWDALGGYDDRFVGWGGEDFDFAWRAQREGRCTRTPGPMWELWHDREPDYFEARHANRDYLRCKVEASQRSS